ncbi:MAG: SUMF1/EgtB/PvdO family nonheme iron enzyme, partial [Bacteroidetes bacterium]|nr:SUMF1/EgtB/PvdO family nonheme iron enzyme [Bacteroidota bacterium]
MAKFITIATLAFLISGCRLSKLSVDITIDNIQNPPGTIKISDNLYFDKAEMTNLGYREFMYWTKIIYGVRSNEYLSIFPNTSVWGKIDTGYSSLDSFYLSHPAYDDYPVVGISYEQAVKYYKWRSDMVMEYILVKNNIIKFKPVISKDSIFTIEKYFNGQYNNIKPSERFMIYPEYSLPDSTTYKIASSFADSLNNRNYKSCKKRYCKNSLLIDCNCFETRA